MEAVVGRREEAYATLVSAGVLTGGSGNLGAEVERAKNEYGGLGLFVRSLTGLDREAATAAFDRFQSGRTLIASPIHFLQLLIDFLSRNGTVEVSHLYEQPFSSHAPGGPEDLFPGSDVDEVVSVLKGVRATAIPMAHAA